MPRAKNSLGTEQITLSVTANIKRYLEVLTMDGMYGKNVADTAAELLRTQVRALVDNGRLPKLPPETSPDSA